MRARKLTVQDLHSFILNEVSKAKNPERGVMTRIYNGKKYTDSSSPLTSAQASHIVATGETTVSTTTKISESQLRSMIRHQLLEDIDGGSVEKALGTVLKPIGDKLDRAFKLAKNDKQKAAVLQMILDKMGISGKDAVKVLSLLAKDERSEKEAKNPMK